MRGVNNHYQWRINYAINHHSEFKEWLIRKNADIFTSKNLEPGEKLKFKLNGGLGILYKTGRCNPFYNKIAKVFQKECGIKKLCVA